ncbi:MAG: hypothetical protein EAX96_21365 [Candidatus Lokiarchaeota archaeon]|nr:hypothetical protein [Candidatus Lokiarchaeota archaeon]
MKCINCKKNILINEGESYYIHEGSKYCYDCYIKSQMESTIDSIISPKIRKMITGAIFSVIGSIFAILSVVINVLIIFMPNLLIKYAPNLLSTLPFPLIFPLISFNLYTILGGIIFVFLGMIGMAWSIISPRRGAELLIISSIGGTICLGLIFAVAAFWYILAAVLGHPDLTKLIPPFLTKSED